MIRAFVRLLCLMAIVISFSVPFTRAALAQGETAQSGSMMTNLSPSPIAAKPFPRTPQSLHDAFNAALARSETVDIQRELLVQANENVSQGYGALAPTISGSATFLHQQIPTNTAVGNPSYLADQSTTKLTADQPLFRGLRDFAALRQRRALARAQMFALKQAAKQLFSDLSIAYYNVLAYQADEKNYLDEIDANNKRLAELRHFLRIGRSRETDLLTFQTNITSLEAQIEVTRGNIENAKDVLAYLTGWNRETPLHDSETTFMATNIDDYLRRMEGRPDVKAALDNAAAYTEGIPIARGAHYPNVDLIGDYYFDRPGVPEGQPDWDIQLAITIPIFQGGIVNSEVRQAQSVANQYEITLSQVRRLAEQEVRTLYDAYRSDLKQVMKLEENVMWSKKNYEAEVKDYRNGLVTNLDVLTAITQWQDAQRQLDHTRMQQRADGVRLLAASAQRPELDIQAKLNN